jgi:hypothetical protein
LLQVIDRIEFRGQEYSDRCTYCGQHISDTAVVILGTDLIFCDEGCVVGFVGSHTANINIRGEGVQCMLS